MLVTGAEDWSAPFLLASSGAVLATLAEQHASIVSVGFSPNGGLLTSLNAAGVLKLWGAIGHRMLRLVLFCID